MLFNLSNKFEFNTAVALLLVKLRTADKLQELTGARISVTFPLNIHAIYLLAKLGSSNKTSHCYSINYLE